MINEEVFKEAIDKYGVDNQILMCIEECSELTTALTQCYRGRTTNKDIATEIADVKIMCEQLSLIFGEELVKEEYDFKIKRLKERLKKTS